MSSHAAATHDHAARRSSGHKRSAPPPAAVDASAAPSLPAAAALLKSLANFDAFVADTLARLYVQPQARVAELHCSQSSLSSRLMTDLTADFHSAASSGLAPVAAPSVTIGNAFAIASYLGVDPDCSAPKQKWILNECPFEAEWLTTDPLAHALWTEEAAAKQEQKAESASATAASSSSSSSPLLSPSHRGSFDVVASFKVLSSKSLSSLAVLRCFLANVSALLKPGGVWMGTCFDSQSIWYKITKREREAGPNGQVKFEPGVGVLVRGPGYTLDCPHLPRTNAQFDSAFSTELRVYLQITGGASSTSAALLPPVVPGVLVHFPTLIAEARSFGLHLLRLHNYVDFHTELAAEAGAPEITQHTARKMKFTIKHAADSKAHLTQLTGPQSELYSLFTTFAFRKGAT